MRQVCLVVVFIVTSSRPLSDSSQSADLPAFLAHPLKNEPDATSAPGSRTDYSKVAVS